MRGGADWADVWQMLLRLGFDLTLNQALTEAAPMAAERLRQRDALRGKQSRVTTQQRNQVLAAASALAGKHSVPTELYRAIAAQLDMKLDRVRYIIEGPRRRKR